MTQYHDITEKVARESLDASNRLWPAVNELMCSGGELSGADFTGEDCKETKGMWTRFSVVSQLIPHLVLYSILGTLQRISKSTPLLRGI